MKGLIALAGVAWMAAAQLCAAEVESIFADEQASVPITLLGQGSVSIGPAAACAERKCKAALAAKSHKIKIPPAKPGMENPNPATPACNALGGKPETYFRKSGSQVAVCAFSDGSFLLTWEWIQKSQGRL